MVERLKAQVHAKQDTCGLCDFRKSLCGILIENKIERSKVPKPDPE
jgi:hypothetical protein